MLHCVKRWKWHFRPSYRRSRRKSRGKRYLEQDKQDKQDTANRTQCHPSQPHFSRSHLWTSFHIFPHLSTRSIRLFCPQFMIKSAMCIASAMKCQRMVHCPGKHPHAFGWSRMVKDGQGMSGAITLVHNEEQVHPSPSPSYHSCSFRIHSY